MVSNVVSTIRASRIAEPPWRDGPRTTSVSVSPCSSNTTSGRPSTYHETYRLSSRTAPAHVLLEVASRSPLDGAGEGGDVVLDEEGVDEGDGDGAEEGARHERSPVEDVAAHQLGEHADRN